MDGEVELNVPASKAWEIFKTNELIKKVNPNLLANAEYIEGDGRPGSIRLFKLGPGVKTYVSESKQRIEEVKEGPGSDVLQMKYRVVEGELKKMYDSYTVTFSFRSDEKNKCIAGWRAEYQSLSPNVAPPDKAKNFALRFLKAIEDFYLSSNFLSTQ
eukprot:PITA_01676